MARTSNSPKNSRNDLYIMTSGRAIQLYCSGGHIFRQLWKQFIWSEDERMFVKEAPALISVAFKWEKLESQATTTACKGVISIMHACDWLLLTAHCWFEGFIAAKCYLHDFFPPGFVNRSGRRAGYVGYAGWNDLTLVSSAGWMTIKDFSCVSSAVLFTVEDFDRTVYGLSD